MSTENQGMGRGMIWVGAILVLLGLTWVFNQIIDARQNPNSEVRTERSGNALAVRLAENRQGHYVASGRINGEDVTFLLDTGATDVALSRGLARSLDLPELAPVRVSTANGVVSGYATRIERVELGGLKLNDVSATVTPNMSDDTVLLGMSFLGEFDWERQGGELILRQPG